MKVKITINCDSAAFGEDDCDKVSELNRIFNVLVYKSLHTGFKNRMIIDLNGKDVGLMEVEE